MQQTVELDETCEVDGVPVSALLSVERKNRYGSVPGLDDEELADPAELEREVVLHRNGVLYCRCLYRAARAGLYQQWMSLVVLTGAHSAQLIFKGRCLSLTRHGTRLRSSGSS